MSTGLTTTTTAIILLMIAIKEGGGGSHRQFWISKAKPIAQQLLDVQALVVKDEEVAVGCKATTTHNDVRYSNKRYLMCAGSILTNRYILTSASCIHQATHIRHNIRAPLAVMIGSFSDTTQVIKIAGYSIHPGHLVDPGDKNHALHNVAVAKLVCRITKRNLHIIQLPTQPFVDECAEDNCKVTITKQIGPMSFVMDEVPVQDIIITDVSVERKKRELLAAYKMNSQNDTVDETRFNSRDIKKVRKSDENNGADNARIIETGERTNNESSKFINQNIFKSKKNSISFKRSLIPHHTGNRKLVTRESHDIKGCPQTGSAVMSNTIQSAMVTISCSDRQPEKPWQYTDLFDNLDWINEMIGNSKPSPTLSGCTTCVYNFFIDYNCKNRAQCQKNLQSGSHPVQSVNCSRNQTDLKNPFSPYRSKSRNDSESMNRAYIEAIYELYIHKHNHGNDNDFERTSEKNSYRSFVETAKPRLFLKSASTDFNVASGKTRVPNYRDNRADLDSNYRQVKATYDNDYKPVGNVADGNEHPERKNRDYKPRYNRINKLDVATTSIGKSVESLEDLFADDNGEQLAIPKDFAGLYQQFLKEHKQSREKINKKLLDVRNKSILS